MGSQRRRQPQHTMHQRWMSTSKRNRTTSQKERGRRKKSGRRGDTTRCDSSRSRSARIESNRIESRSNRIVVRSPLFPSQCASCSCVRWWCGPCGWGQHHRAGRRHVAAQREPSQPPPSGRRPLDPQLHTNDQRRTAPPPFESAHCKRAHDDEGRKGGKKKTRRTAAKATGGGCGWKSRLAAAAAAVAVRSYR